MVCSHCRVLYDLLEVKVSESYFEDLIRSRRDASIWLRRKVLNQMFQYFASVAREFRFVRPPEPNAIVFLLANTRSPFPQAVYFRTHIT